VGFHASAADLVDPDTADRQRATRPELANPVTLAGHLDKTYQVRSHLTLIGDELAALERGDTFDRLMVNTPPRVGKTKTAVEWFVFWWLIKHPTDRVIVGSYGDDLARRAGRNIRRLVATYGPMYGLQLERGSAAANDWSLTTGGGVRSVGIGSGITGHDGDLIVIDDPTKSRAEAESVARRDAIWDWYSADIGARVVPGTRMLLIQTPWHPDDLRARVVQQEGNAKNGGAWRVVVMAALAEDPDDPLGRGYGEPLPHPKIAEGDTFRLMKYWERMRSMRGVRDWRALYQCDPKAPEGLLVKPELMRQRRCFEHGTCEPRKRRIGVTIDPSGGGRDTAGVMAGYLGEDEKLYFTHDKTAVMPSEEWGRVACDLAVEVDADCFVVEKTFGGDMAALILRTSWDALRREQPDRFEDRLIPRIIEVHARLGKVIRAEPIGQQWVEARILMAAYLPDLESEWTTYVPGTRDSPGRLDCSVHLAYEFLPLPRPGAATNEGAAIMAGTDLLAGLFGRHGR
jgi:hypothetical protein